MSMSNAGRRRRLTAAVVALLAMAIIGTTISSGLAATPAARRHANPSARAHDTAAIGFSHAVIVDQQRPGNEPDVKVAPNGSIFTSVPFGFSTTQSFLWSSRDKGNSYQLVPGTIGPGKPATCAGGGDTDLFIDPGNALYFSDLQGLTNISNSKSTDGGATFTTNCAGAPNAPDDRMWFTGTGSSTGGNLNLYQDYDAVNGSASGGNQLVETVSHDGTTFTPVVNTDPVGSNCAGTGVYDCVTNNEGISGNQVVDPSTGNVFIAHTTSNSAGVQVSEGKITQGTPTTATWTESPNLDQALCADPNCADRPAGNPEELAGENFASIARDSAGYLYVTFTAGSLVHNPADPNFGGLTAPEQIYVVHSLTPAGADPSKLTWSAPQKITGSGASAGTNTFPWITAGSDGRIDVAWYHTSSTSESGTCASGSGTCTLYGAANLNKAEWTVQMGQSLNAHDPSPAFSTADVTEAPIKYGQICTSGLGCTTGGDRSLGDFLQVTTDGQGAAVVTYVNDTSNDSGNGENAGPEQISRQLSGPGLLASATVSQNGGPGLTMGSVTDPSSDAFYSANGSRTPAGDNLDLTGASLANGANRTLVAKINVKSLASLNVSPSLGGPDASWLIRWTQVTPGKTGNGDIYYVGMDNNAVGSGSPTFFAGDTTPIPVANPAERTKYLAFPQTHKLTAAQASYDKSTGVITLNVPLSDVGSPADGTHLYSATGFSATSSTPQSAATLFNLTDATTPFELVIGPPGTTGGSGSGSGPGSTSNGHGRCPVATGRLSARGVGRLTLGMNRGRARKLYPRWSTRGRRYTDFYCARPIGLRGGYPTPAMLRPLSKRARRRQQGRLVLILSANHRYALHGVRPGTRLKQVAKRLHVSRRYRVGSNDWYLTGNGTSRGVLKVRRGVILEVGIAAKALTANRAADRHFFRTLRSL